MKDYYEIINLISPTEAQAILKDLAEKDTQLAQRIAEMALDRLSEVDPEEMAAVLYYELDHLEGEEVWDQAGPTRNGYVEPRGIAEQMIEKVLAPYLAELERYGRFGLSTQANRLCMGLLAGLYQFEYESSSKFKDWASNAPIAFAETVVAAWRVGSPGQADIRTLKTFVEDELNGWCVRFV